MKPIMVGVTCEKCGRTENISAKSELAAYRKLEKDGWTFCHVPICNNSECKAAYEEDQRKLRSPFASEYGEEFIPRRKTMHSAGYDIYATSDIELKPGEWTYIDTGISLTKYPSFGMVSLAGRANPECLAQYATLLIYPRSSMAFKYGLRMINGVGIIDADYRDTIKVKVTVDAPLTLHRGDRYLQAIIQPLYMYSDEIPPEDTRVGGIGSTGQ